MEIPFRGGEGRGSMRYQSNVVFLRTARGGRVNPENEAGVVQRELIEEDRRLSDVLVRVVGEIAGSATRCKDQRVGRDWRAEAPTGRAVDSGRVISNVSCSTTGSFGFTANLFSFLMIESRHKLDSLLKAGLKGISVNQFLRRGGWWRGEKRGLQDAWQLCLCKGFEFPN